jgi:hypothetical protein
MKTKKTTKKAATAKAKTPAKATKPAANGNPKKISQIEAAVQVLAKAKEPMNCAAMVDAMAAAGLWSSPGGKTPASTLYASILRELNTKGKDARFVKKDRGLFALRK